jgi:hypothetical protein
MIMTMCHQVPSMLAVMHHLGMFYLWHAFNVTTNAGQLICGTP